MYIVKVVKIVIGICMQPSKFKLRAFLELQKFLESCSDEENFSNSRTHS